jgi:RimJ/RimL family protein N-acetyltransferase
MVTWLPGSWGAGLAAQTLTVLIDWFFTEVGEPILIAVTQDANIRSTRLLERLGATLTTTFEQYGAPQRQYEFTRARWELKRSRPDPQP